MWLRVPRLNCAFNTCRRDGKAITLSHDALLVALVGTASHVKQAADDKLKPVSVELSLSPDNSVRLSVSPTKINPGGAANTGNVPDAAAAAAEQGNDETAQTAPGVADNCPCGAEIVAISNGKVEADAEDTDMAGSSGDDLTAVVPDADADESCRRDTAGRTAAAHEAATDTEETAAQAAEDDTAAADTKVATAATSTKTETGTEGTAASKPASKGKQAGPYAPGAGKRSDLTFLDPMNKADCPPKAIALAAGELVLRVREEKRRRKAGGLIGKSQLPMLRMSGNSPGKNLLLSDILHHTSQCSLSAHTEYIT